MRAILLMTVVILGCGTNTPNYFPPDNGPLEVGAMGQPREATAVVTLPFRVPTDGERQDLMSEAQGLGFAAPWLRRRNIAISIQYSITNLDKDRGTAQVLVDGANEFTSYDARAIRAAMLMAGANNNDVVVLSLIQGVPVSVEPGQTVSGVVREDDIAEAELDLDAIGRWMATPAAVLINASEVNAVGLERVPAEVVIPALFRVSVTFTSNKHMRLDFLVRVRDKKDQLLLSDGDTFAPMAAAYAPRP